MKYMKKFLAAILFFFFLIFAGGIMKTVFSMNMEEIAALSQKASDRTGYSSNNDFHNRLAAIEINKLFQAQNVANARVGRTTLIEMSDLLRTQIYNLSSYRSTLAQHSGKLYTSTISFSSAPMCEYYVFALRHIII